MKVIFVGGARPNFMKIAPILEEVKKSPLIEPILVHTGQHYDRELSDVFFEELGIPAPDRCLGVGSGSHAKQTARVMIEFEEVLLSERPRLVAVVGDVNSTLACSITSAKLHVPVAHVEAGLRSFDRSMPEEINRIVTDSLSTILFTTCEDANINLKREGVKPDRIHFVGNVMIDCLERHKEIAWKSRVLEKLSLKEKDYAVLTLHRPSNVDDAETLSGILSAVEKIQRRLPVVFPVHPRTRKNLTSGSARKTIESSKSLILLEPLGYIDFLRLLLSSRLILTDSGGIQEESTVLGVPCLTLRENTERPVTVTSGTNTIVGTDPDRIIHEAFETIDGRGKEGRVPPLWDGNASSRIASVIEDWLKKNT
ncbi:MAG: UDP-N-acetylglucosamine 2-epimerase (non-hydrolyzing) [Candidatus Eisenbacteria bacterium]|nr:UDP-N-acetylglucosamine 2-epimerase (non-hydrolyzing) [Candidatus Eisenbacteria bacterium]